jgi:6-pyruvoyltetrahydropterin/6-carboxytetrahydropterin synthase
MTISKKIECVRKLWFCAGHRVVGHENKCANVHGHNFTLWIYASADRLDDVGRVVDFSVLKEKVGTWIDENWDHTFLMNRDDDLLMPIKDQLTVNKEVFICDFNPTAENMASYLLEVVCPKLMSGTGVNVDKIEIFETENNKVIVTKN